MDFTTPYLRTKQYSHLIHACIFFPPSVPPTLDGHLILCSGSGMHNVPVCFSGSVTVGDPISLSPELSDEDLNVVNMLLSEEVGAEFWTDVLFDKTSSGS